MPMEQDFPLRVEQVPAAAFDEWRTGDSLPEAVCDTWQLVYLSGGSIEEQCDARIVTLRAGQLLFHQPGETWSMQVPGEVPPEVLRLDFVCSGAVMDDLRGRVLRADLSAKVCLQQIRRAMREAFAPAAPGQIPAPRADAPLAAAQLLCVYVEILLITLVRAQRRTRRPSTRARIEREQQMLVDMVQVYFADHLSQELTVDQVCRDNGCTRARLQKAFRARVHKGPMEAFAAMKMDRARLLLAGGCTPGETAARLGFADSAYFSRCFKRAYGVTPRDFARHARKAAAAKAATNRYTTPPNVHVTKPDGEVE